SASAEASTRATLSHRTPNHWMGHRRAMRRGWARLRAMARHHFPSPRRRSISWSAQQNVIDSERYEQLLRTNPAFRRARMQKECGGITDLQLRQSCFASFDEYKS